MKHQKKKDNQNKKQWKGFLKPVHSDLPEPTPEQLTPREKQIKELEIDIQAAQKLVGDFKKANQL